MESGVPSGWWADLALKIVAQARILVCSVARNCSWLARYSTRKPDPALGKQFQFGDSWIFENFELESSAFQLLAPLPVPSADTLAALRQTNQRVSHRVERLVIKPRCVR